MRSPVTDYSDLSREERARLYHHLSDALRKIAEGKRLCMPWMKDQWEENLQKLKEMMKEKGEEGSRQEEVESKK